MSHPDYEMIGTPEDKVIEEAAELIQAIMKARRFGYFNFNPLSVNKTTNILSIQNEMYDVEMKLREYKRYLRNILLENCRKVEGE